MGLMRLVCWALVLALVCAAGAARAEVDMPKFRSLNEYLEWLSQDDALEMLGADRVRRSRRTENCLMIIFPGDATPQHRQQVLEAVAEQFVRLAFKENATMQVFVEGQTTAGRVTEQVGRTITGQTVLMGTTCE